MSYRFRLPPDTRSHPAFGVGSVVFHVLLAVLLLIYSGPTFDRSVQRVSGEGRVVRMIELPAYVGGPVDRRTGGPETDVTDTLRARQTEIAIVPPREVPTGISPVPPERAERGAGPPGGEETAEGDRPARPGRRLLGARIGDGRLWVRPRDAIAAAIASALDAQPADAETHVERLDSAVAARIYAFLDTLPRDSMSPARPPSWVTEIDGQTWGIDGSWIYLGGLKLPTAILALLPLPQGNYDESRRAAELQRVRADILQAARRAETADQFRRYVRETRERRNAERERERNQRIPPDSSGGGR